MSDGDAAGHWLFAPISGAFRASVSSTAMRMATPISTCSGDQGARLGVGDAGFDLDAAVHRARVHDDRVGLGGEPASLRRGPRSGSTRGSEGTVGSIHPLLLQAQHHHHVAVLQALARMSVKTFRAPAVGRRAA